MQPDFPPNSQKARMRSEAPRPGERPEKIERVTSAEAVRRKRGLGRQFKDTFIDGNARMAYEYMVKDVVVPGIQNMIFDALQSGLDRLIYGENRPRRTRSHMPSYSDVGRVNYQSMSSPTQMAPTRPPAPRMLSQRSRALQDFGEIVIQSRPEATDVLDRMYDWLSRYGIVTVAEFYEMVGIKPAHTDHKWGWTQLRGARVTPLRGGGYLLDLPEPESLDT